MTAYYELADGRVYRTADAQPLQHYANTTTLVVAEQGPIAPVWGDHAFPFAGQRAYTEIRFERASVGQDYYARRGTRFPVVERFKQIGDYALKYPPHDWVLVRPATPIFCRLSAEDA